MEGKAVIIVGNITEGYEIVGPFDTWDEAAQFDATCADPEYNPKNHTTWIVTLTEPPKPDLTTTRDAVEKKHL